MMEVTIQSSDYIDKTTPGKPTCELCGSTIGTGNAGHEAVTADELLRKVAECLARNPIATEIALLALVNPDMSVRELSVIADRKGHGKVYRAIRKARGEEGGLIPMACLCDRARSQQSRFEQARAAEFQA